MTTAAVCYSIDFTACTIGRFVIIGIAGKTTNGCIIIFGNGTIGNVFTTNSTIGGKAALTGKRTL